MNVVGWSTRESRARTACSLALAAAAAAGLAAPPALADAGIRDFADTMLIDDPDPNDVLILPTLIWQRSGVQDGVGPTNEFDAGIEIDKRNTTRLGLQVSTGGVWQSVFGSKSRTGMQNASAGLQYMAWKSAKTESELSFGVQQEFGGTGSQQIGESATGSTTPLVYFGQGWGALPIGVLRPFAVTGEFGYAISNKGLKQLPAAPGNDPTYNNGIESRWVAGMTLQYPLNYLDGEVLSLNWPQWVDNFVPLVEVSYSSPATKPANDPVQWTIAPGVLWSDQFYQFGVEALIPGNRASGRNVGVLAQFRMSLGVLVPRLGKPVFSGD